MTKRGAFANYLNFQCLRREYGLPRELSESCGIILLHHNSPGLGDPWQILVLEEEVLQEAGDSTIESILEVFKGTTTQATGVAEAPTQDSEEVSGVTSTTKKVLTWFWMP